MFSSLALAAAAALLPSIMRVICHCCRMDRMLFTSQYNTRPAGKKKNMTPKANGMNASRPALISSQMTGRARFNLRSSCCDPSDVTLATSGYRINCWARASSHESMA